MQPTGMSVRRCVAALSGLSGELDRVTSNGGGEPGAPRVSLQELIQDLALDVDLRHDAASKSLMSQIESEVYLPVIEKVLTLLRRAEAGEMRAHPMAEAIELTHGALRTAVERAGDGSA